MNRYGKRVVSVVMAFVVTAVSFFVFALPEQAYAASTGKGISRSRAVMRTSSTLKLTIKNPGKTVRWKTSNKKIAYVKTVKGKLGRTAVIKAGKKTGKCTITAKSGSRTYTCTIRTIKLSASTKELTSSINAGKADRLGPDSRFKRSATDFSFELLRQTVAAEAAKGKDVNVLISPDSVLSALVMVENGAKGKTLKEMQNVLSGDISIADYNRYLSGLNNRLASSESIQYHVANSIWTRKGKVKVKKKFLKTNKKYHNAQVFSADFNKSAVRDMNRWVAGNTNGMIKQIINRLSPEDKLVVINAIAFEGSWANKFPQPSKDIFTAENGKKVKVDMLRQRDRMDYVTINGGRGFAKLYSGGDIAFVGLLPPEGSTVDEYLAGLSGSRFVSAWKAREGRTLDICLPEFKYDYSTSMAGPLKAMGMKRAFSSNADFTAMIAPSSSTSGVHIDDVLHKTHIELDRNGTKAAAATAVIMKAGSVLNPEDVTEVHLDRPFVYAIVDTRTGIPLFAGIYRTAD